MPDRSLPKRFGALSVPGHHPDPEDSTDPAIRSVLVALRTLPAPDPDSVFRAELRSQLVAVAPRLVAEGISADAESAAPRAMATMPTRAAPIRRRLGLRRPLVALASAATVSAVLLGVGVWKSNDSVPGDTLYGLKRADENVQLSLTGGDGARGKAYLDRAQTRVDETLSIWTDSVPASEERVVASGNGETADQMERTLNEADADVKQGAKLIGESVVSGLSADALAAMLQWAPGQLARLKEIADQIPPGPLHTQALRSVLLVKNALQRAQDLAAEAQSGCQCLSSAPADDLGPMPCPACASSSPGQPGSPATTTPAVPGTPSGSSGSGEPGSGAPSGSGGSTGSSDSTPSPSSDTSSDTGTGAATTGAGSGASGAGAGTPSPLAAPVDPPPAAAPVVPPPAAPAPPPPAAPAAPPAAAPAPAGAAAAPAAPADPAPPADPAAAAASGPDPAAPADDTSVLPASTDAAPAAAAPASNPIAVAGDATTP